MNKLLSLFLFFTLPSMAQTINLKGNLDYTQESEKSFSSSNSLEYKLKIYTHKKFDMFLTNNLNVDLDVFKNQIKETNVFTTIQIEF
jgi:hypothetical protein